MLLLLCAAITRTDPIKIDVNPALPAILMDKITAAAI
jgi:hypothetical protein